MKSKKQEAHRMKIRDYIVEKAMDGIYHRESTTKSAVMWWEK